MSAHASEIARLNAAARCLADLALRLSGPPLPTAGDAEFLAAQVVQILSELRSVPVFAKAAAPPALDAYQRFALADLSAMQLRLTIAALGVEPASELTERHASRIDGPLMETLSAIAETIKALSAPPDEAEAAA
jgi:hypothetical protein